MEHDQSRQYDRLSKMERKKDLAKEIEESIRRILFDVWDPVGVNDIAPLDEYDSYIGGVYRLLASGATQETVAAHLKQLEIDYMELAANPARRNIVASKLLRLDISIED